MATWRPETCLRGAMLLAASALAACTVQPKSPTYDAIIGNYIGKTEAELVSAWGIPQKTHQLSAGGQVLEYVRDSNGIAVCTTRFTVDKTGRVSKTWYKGTSCG